MISSRLFGAAPALEGGDPKREQFLFRAAACDPIGYVALRLQAGEFDYNGVIEFQKDQYSVWIL